MSEIQKKIDKIKKNYTNKKHKFKIGDIVDIYKFRFIWQTGNTVSSHIGYGRIYDIEPQYEVQPITIDNICYLDISIHEIEDSIQVDEYEIFPVKNRKKDFDIAVKLLEKKLYG